MKRTYTVEMVVLVSVIALSLAGFSSLLLGAAPKLDGYQYLHVATSLGWLLLLLSQLVLIRQRRFKSHRSVGLCIFGAGPVLVATLVLLTVHSAAKSADAGRADDMVVPNVMVTLEVALLVFLAFWLRGNRAIHGALLLSTALLFAGIALFFTLIAWAPAYRIEGPDTFHRFAEAAQASTVVVLLAGLLLFLRDRRGGWPWLLAGSMFALNGLLQMLVERADFMQALTIAVAALGRLPAFALGLGVFLALLGVAWRREAGNRGRKPVSAGTEAAR
ncbi:MAG: hypothetical protein LW860_06030 [Xanthomonadaceae bacterium]|jgi:hypothetical protein|nr:hypothetical protein [Xanthomonadaceae bacterium]